MGDFKYYERVCACTTDDNGLPRVCVWEDTEYYNAEVNSMDEEHFIEFIFNSYLVRDVWVYNLWNFSSMNMCGTHYDDLLFHYSPKHHKGYLYLGEWKKEFQEFILRVVRCYCKEHNIPLRVERKTFDEKMHPACYEWSRRVSDGS